MPNQEKDFHKWRRQGVCGSDAPKILGVHGAYGDALDVWQEKLGLQTARETTAVMQRGKDLEQMIASKFCQRTGKEIVRAERQEMAENPVIRCHPDFIIQASNGDPATLLSIKTRSTSVFRRYQMQGLMPSDLVQVCHERNVMGWQDRPATVFVWCPDLWDGAIFEVQPDPELQASLIKVELEFWAYVQNRQVPTKFLAEQQQKPEQLPATKKTDIIYPQDEEWQMLVEALAEAEAIKDDATTYWESVRDKIHARLQQAEMPCAEGQHSNGQRLRYYYRQMPGRKTLDHKILLAQVSSWQRLAKEITLGKDSSYFGKMSELMKQIMQFVPQDCYKQGASYWQSRRYWLRQEPK